MQTKIKDGVEEFSKIFTIPWPLTHKKGIKLDVKRTNIVKPCVDMLVEKGLCKTGSAVPTVWLN